MRILQKMAWGVGGLLGVVLIGFALLQIDDELKPEAAAWLATTSERQVSSRAYYSLAGIDAPADADMLSVGKTRVTMAQSGVMPDMRGTMIALPEIPLLCNVSETGCYSKLFTHPEAIADVLAKHTSVQQRYQQFVVLDDYQTLVSPRQSLFLPRYSPVIAGRKLLHLSLIRQAIMGDPQGAVDALQQHMTHMHRLIHQDETLIGQMVWLSSLSADIDLLAILVNRYSVQVTAVMPIGYLPVIYEKMLRAEFAMNNHHIVTGSGDVGGVEGVERMFRRAGFKTNRTLNYFYDGYQRLIAMSDLPAKQFLSEYQAGSYLDMDYDIRNLFGKVMSNMVLPNYAQSLVRYHILNTKIAMMNHILLNPEQPKQALADFRSPFDGKLLIFSDQGKKACFAHPLPKENQPLVCLWLAS